MSIPPPSSHSRPKVDDPFHETTIQEETGETTNGNIDDVDDPAEKGVVLSSLWKKIKATAQPYRRWKHDGPPITSMKDTPEGWSPMDNDVDEE